MNNSIAIIFFGDYFYDARCYNMAQSIAKKKLSVDVYHTGVNINNDSIQLTNINIINLGKKTSRINLLWWFFFLNKKIKKKYHTFIAADLYSLLAISPLKTNRNIIYDARDIFSELPFKNFNFLKKIFWSALEDRAIKKVRAVLSTARTDMCFFKKKFKKEKNINYKIIYNFPSIDCLDKTKKNNINRKKTTLIYQGAIQRGRGIGLFLKIIKHNSSFSGIIVGSGAEKKKYIKKAKHLNISNRVLFYNKIPYKQLLSITASAHVGCALIEPCSLNNINALPNKLFEYASCGVPTLASNLPNMVQFINNYKIGRTVNINNFDEVNSSIDRLLCLKKNKIKSIAKHKLSWESQEKKFLKIVMNE